ncbi:MAG: hypothetical protein FWD22_02495 [Treponema sp.]|nr:hypothetical protein [Treponema sp.]
MAVVCSSGLVGKAVTLIALEKKSPIMIVTNVAEETKTVEVTWLDNNNSVNTAAFPSKALDKAEAQPKQTTAAKKPAPKKKK